MPALMGFLRSAVIIWRTTLGVILDLTYCNNMNIWCIHSGTMIIYTMLNILVLHVPQRVRMKNENPEVARLSGRMTKGFVI